MKACDDIIDRFGGLTSLARALGHKHASTVQGWKQRGVIPALRQQEVLNAALRLGIDLSPADFFEPVDTPHKRREERAA
ncbi:carph-isopro domain-containing protein [Inquilinus sp. YAF38]|uniref:carph-isopro domain-containing protein n=1 Tax=Inquilinus sp. YAF38 TaxID=3233084 RepID=UPI003F8EE571